MGTGSYCDAIYSSFYGIQALTYDVEIEENVLTPGVYRLTSPYGEGTDFYDTFIDTDTPSFLWAGSSNPGLVINATDPQHVYISGTCTPGTDDGMASQGYGVMRLYSVVDDYLSQGASLSQIAAQMPQCFGTLENGVITLPEMGIYIGFTDNINEILGYLDLSSGAVALPGYVISDYSSAFTYKGCFIDVAGNSYIQGTVTLGGDVASAKYVIAANGDDVQAIIDAVNDGSIEGTEITESGEVSIAMSESGDYNFIIITYDAAGNMQGSSATPFTFTSGSVVDDTDWQFVCNGTYYHVISPLFSDAEPLFDESNYTTTLYQDPEDPSRYRISPWGGNPYVELSFDFTMNADNTITFADIESGWEVKDQQGNVYSLFGADAFTMSNQWPNSYYDPTENVYYFASVYYAIINGQAQPVYGEWDAFIPSGSAQNVMNMPAKAPYRLGAKKAKFTQKDLKGFTPEKYGKFVKVNRL